MLPPGDASSKLVCRLLVRLLSFKPWSSDPLSAVVVFVILETVRLIKSRPWTKLRRGFDKARLVKAA